MKPLVSNTFLDTRREKAPGSLPPLATAAQMGRVIQVTSRTVTGWAAAGVIPVALRQGKILRFSPPAVFRALNIDFGETAEPGAIPQKST